MKERVYKYISIIFALCSFCLLTVSCSYFTYGGNLVEILNEPFESKITFYDVNPNENSDVLSYEKTFKIGTSYNRSAIVLDSSSGFEEKHGGYDFCGWKYLCNAYDSSITDLPEEIVLDNNGFINDFTMPVDSFCVYAWWEPAKSKSGTVTVTFPDSSDAVISFNYDSTQVTYKYGSWTVPVSATVTLPDSSAAIASYAWYSKGNVTIESTASSASLIFTAAGYYQVVVMVTDSNGNIYTSEIEIQIIE